MAPATPVIERVCAPVKVALMIDIFNLGPCIINNCLKKINIKNYLFTECDKSCNGCNGDGPDMCIKCADGHHMKENFCISMFSFLF